MTERMRTTIKNYRFSFQFQEKIYNKIMMEKNIIIDASFQYSHTT